ncbi:MAG: methylenetetrahydrofolate reductase [Thermodesulfobacteriota bacterium]
MKPFEQVLGEGSVLVVQFEPPAGPRLDEWAAGAEKLRDKVSAFLVSDNPAGETRVSPLLAARALADRGLETIVTLSCRDRNRLALASDLLAAEAAGLKNVLAVSGDHPVTGPNPGARPVYDLDSVQLLALIQEMNQGREPGGRPLDPPTSLFAGAVVNPEVRSPGGQFLKLRLKAATGAKFICTQAVFHPDKYLEMIEQVRDLGVKFLAGLRLIGPAEVGEITAGRRPWLNQPLETKAGLEAAPERALEISLALAQQTAGALRGRTDGFVIMAPGLNDRLPEILERLELE